MGGGGRPGREVSMVSADDVEIGELLASIAVTAFEASSARS